MKILRTICRILVGLVFIFSGFVKGVDPIGFAYKIEDYFIAYGMQWASPLAITLSIILCAFEFSLGVYLVLNIKPKLTSWLALLLMCYFTVLTFFDALNNPVPDCGCFGDAVKLTNWQTFYKNVVLIALTILVFSGRKYFITPWTKISGISLLILIPLCFILFETQNYRHLPFIDFNTWKVGNLMIPKNPKPVEYYLVYQNKTSGEKKEMLSKDLPYNDSVWMSKWEFKSQKVVDPNVYPAPNFKILDPQGTDVTSSFLRNPGYQFFVVCVEVNKTNNKALDKLRNFTHAAMSGGYGIIGLTGSLPEVVTKFESTARLDIPFYQSDDTELKAMVRSNPGLVLMKNSRVIKKWAWRDLPTFEKLKQMYPL